MESWHAAQQRKEPEQCWKERWRCQCPSNQNVGINENGRPIRRCIEREEIEQDGIRHNEVRNEIQDENEIGEVNDEINLEKDENQNEQEWIEPPANDLVAIMAKQTRLLQALAQDRHSNNGKNTWYWRQIVRIFEI